MSNMYCLYQMKDEPGNAAFLHQSYEYVISHGGSVTESRYDCVYKGLLLKDMSASTVRKTIQSKPRRVFSNRAPGLGDVVTMDMDGQTECYYLDDIGMVRLAGFFESTVSESAPLTPYSTNFHISGKPGLWQVADTVTVEGQVFFLMESMEHGRQAAGIISDAVGHIVTDDARNDFDDETVLLIRKFILPDMPIQMPQQSQSISAQVHTKPEQERFHRFYENGTYERSSSSEATEESNYNMIDGQNNNAKKKDVSRESVRKRLKEKQAILHGSKQNRQEKIRI